MRTGWARCPRVPKLAMRPSTSERAAPRYARPFVALFVTAVVLCPLFGANAWPFSSWRLFSALRTANATSWQAVTVDAAGDERDFPLASVSHGYRGFGLVMGEFSKRTPAARDGICRAWVHAATKGLGPGNAEVRIYQVHWLLSERRGRRSVPAQRVLAWVCDPEGARAAS